MDDDDARLVGAARAGDRGAFARLIERHRPLLVATVRRMAGGELAEEAAQEAVLQAMLGLDRLREPSRFGPWLAGIGLNVCRRLLRRRPALPWLPAMTAADPHELAEAAEMVARVREAVAALPAGQRRAVTLFYLAGLSQREVAAALGIDVGAVKGRLHKARRALRERLVEFEETDMTGSDLVEVRVVDVHRHEAKNVVVLEEAGGERWLPVWIGPYEADFLAVHLEDLEMVRPLTYAFAARLLDAAGGTLEEVRISRLAGETYYAEVVVAGPDGARRTVDARPSDALNLAVLLRRPVRVAREVLDVAGRPASEAPAAATTASGIVDELLDRLGSSHTAVRRRG